MSGPTFFRTFNQPATFSKCKRCGKRIRWALNTATCHWLPLNERAVAIRTDVDPATQRKFPVFSAEALHVWACRPAPTRK